MTVADLMSSPPITVRRSVSVAAALARMRRADVRHLAVTDTRGRLVGIVSDRDLLRAGDRRVGEVMSEEVLTVRPETQAQEASGLLLDKKLGALPVVADDGSLVGMITETDFLRVAHQALGGDL